MLTEYNREYGHKMFYPNGPSRTSPATALYNLDNPPPLCDYPRYAKMELLRSAVNTGQRYDSSPALQVAIAAQQYKLPQFKNAMPSLPKVRIFKQNEDAYTGKDHIISMERWFKSSGLSDNDG